jgi:4-amino-4-deoxy-L-arabinose transferase-like glycosyltransferase
MMTPPVMTPARRSVAAGCAALGLLALLLAFYRLGDMALLDPDEARYAQTSREMAQRGDWVVPYYNGEPRLKKPPLYHWENIATFALFGVNEWAARLPSALAYLALIAATVAFGRRERGWTAGLRAGAIVATVPLAFVAGRMVLLDMTLSLLIAAALFVFWQADRGGIRAIPGSVLVGALTGLAILVKGPVGILLPALIMAVFCLSQGEWRRLLRWQEIVVALGVSLAFAIPWLALVIGRVGLGPFWSVAFRETVERYADTGLDHPQPAWFYLGVLVLAAFPWSAFLLPAFVTGILRYLVRRRGVSAEPTARLASFLWIWIAGTLAFFSIGRGKLATYILPLMPAVGLLLSLEWERWTGAGQASPRKRRLITVEWTTALVLILPAVGLTWLVVEWDPAHSNAFLQYWRAFLVLAVAVAGGTIIFSASRWRGAVVPLLAGCLAVFYLYGVSIAGGRLEEARSLRIMVRESGLDRMPGTRMCVYRDYHPSLVFYTNRRVERADAKDDLREFLAQPGDAVVVMDADRLAALSPRLSSQLEPIARQGRQIALRRIFSPGAAR